MKQNKIYPHDLEEKGFRELSFREMSECQFAKACSWRDISLLPLNTQIADGKVQNMLFTAMAKSMFSFSTTTTTGAVESA